MRIGLLALFFCAQNTYSISMRKFLSLFLILLACALNVFCAPSPSAELDTFDEKDNYAKYGLFPIIKGKPIKYFYEVKAAKPAEQTPTKEAPSLYAQIDDQTRQSKYTELIEQNLIAWPTQTAAFIKRAGRADEFADIMPLLSSVKVEKVTKRAGADVVFIFADMAYIQSRAKGDIGCGITADFGTPVEIIILDPNLNLSTQNHPCLTGFKDAYDFAKKTLFHETGHYYGLADMYDTSNISVVYSNSDRFGRESIMGASYGGQLDCDDVDGLIKLADRTFYKINRRYNERDNKGWASLCNDGTIYKQGKVQDREPLFSGWKLYQYNPNGDLSTIVDKTPYKIDQTNQIITDPQTGKITKVIDAQNGLVTTYQYSADADSAVVEARIYSGQDTYKDFKQYVKDKVNNSWDINHFKLFIADGKCHFQKKGQSFINAYVGQDNKLVSWDFSYDSENNTYIRVRKYDFNGKDYKCEYSSLAKNTQHIRYQYVLNYNGAKNHFRILKEPENTFINQGAVQSLQEICAIEPTYFGAMGTEDFAAACAFFKMADK